MSRRSMGWLTTAVLALTLSLALVGCGGTNSGKTMAQSKNVFFPIITP